MSTFDFLSNITLGEDVKPKASSGGGVKKQRNPENADIRVFTTGAVYPSVALVAKYDLEYRAKSAPDTGNGFDVFQSKDWAVTASLPHAFLLIGAVPKDAPKVSLFNLVRFDKDGAPMTTVLEQGAPTFGKELLEYIETTYGATPNAEGFIDLVIVEAYPLRTSNGVANVPKKIARGEKAGQESYERRENATFFPLAVVEGHVSAPKVVDEAAAIAGEETPAAPAVETQPEEMGVTLPPAEAAPVETTTQSAPEAPIEGELPAETSTEVPVEELLNQPTMGDLWPTEGQEPSEEEQKASDADAALEL